MNFRISRVRGAHFLSAAFASLAAAACVPVDSQESLVEDSDGAGAEESVAEAPSSIAITRVVPIRFIEPMACKPGNAGCSTNTTPEILRAAVDRANEVFVDQGIKFWIKSFERYHLPKFATKNGNLYNWSQVKNPASGTTEDTLRTVFPNMPSNAYDDSIDIKSVPNWMRSTSAFYGDPDELVIWLTTPGAAGGQSEGQFPEHGRHVLIVTPNLSAQSGSDWWATTHLGHEIGHFFGVRHPEAGVAGRNPQTNLPWTNADQWDLVYCASSASQFTRFFSSKSDFNSYGCNSGIVGRILTGSNCSANDPFGVVSCTVDGGTYSHGDLGVDEVLWVDPDVAHNPPDTIKYGTNVMSYYSYYSNRDTRSPSRFTESQLTQISRYKDYDLVYDSVDQTAIKRADGTLPYSGRPDGLAGLRPQLGTASEDLIWWANGDMTFKSQTKPVAGTNYTPASGDFDDDGYDDMLWYDSATGNGYIWWSNGNKTFTSSSLMSFGAGFKPMVGDFDNHYGDDIFFYGPSTDKILWANGDGTFTTETKSVSNVYTPIAGDFDAQGGDDIFWYNPSNGYVNIWWANGSTRTFTGQNNVYVGAGFTPIAGNFDGLIGTDVFWYAPGNAADSIWFSNTDKTFDARSISIFGTYTPVVGDYDGDGADDILWDAQNATTDYLWRAVWNRNAPFDTTGRASIYGAFKPVAGKFDGTWQGKNATDIFFYRQ